MSCYDHLTQEDKPTILKPKCKDNLIKRVAKIFPILVISSALHLLILLVIALIPGEEGPTKEDPVVIINPDKWVDEIQDEKTPDKIIVCGELDTNLKVDVKIAVNPSKEIEQPFIEKVPLDETPPIEPPEQPELPQLNLSPNLNPSIPDLVALEIESVMNNTLSGVYGKRNPSGIARCIQEHNGNGTQEAVHAALDWLAAHQEKDGSWDPVKHEGREHNKNNPVAATAVATLPFYGAGYTERNEEYSQVIKKSITYLNREVYKHRKKPQFGSNYGTALVLMALSESAIMANNVTSKRNAEYVAQFLIDQYTTRPGQGWGYLAAGTDLSVTGWVILALKTAKMANLKALKTKDAEQAEVGYKTWLAQVTDATTGMGSYRPGHNPTPNMTYVGMFVKQSLHFKDDPFLNIAAQNTIKWANSNTTFQENKPKNLYGAYYGTLAAFQAGSETWSAWNPVMKKALVLSQRTGDVKGLGGSWDPTHDHTGEIGGRVYTTALLALTLEIYYRYSQMN